MPVPAAPASAAFTPRSDGFSTARGPLAVTLLERASVLLGWDGKAIYVDPTSTAIDDAALPKADVILVTHDHYDHCDAVALARLQKPGTTVVGPPALLPRTRVDVVLRNGEAREVAGIGVLAVPMYNLQRGPGPGLLYHPPGRGNGYVLDLAGTRVYFSGDTECTPEMKAIQGMDIAFVSVSLPTTMGAEEAAACLEAMHPGVAFPYHETRPVPEAPRGARGQRHRPARAPASTSRRGAAEALRTGTPLRLAPPQTAVLAMALRAPPPALRASSSRFFASSSPARCFRASSTTSCGARSTKPGTPSFLSSAARSLSMLLHLAVDARALLVLRRRGP